ncbi:putative secreted protein [Lachnellula suecica]|uniref:Putative secreted protein n=1 Tax=Lachnellula suecica TaxID=602035 RepID=A0A8T9C2H6_9HELO|nr:putative secreted protein [Lachnellula suecica]
MLSKFLTLALAATVFAYAMPAAQTSPVTPNPSQVSIAGIAYGGTGCPQGSIGSFISADRQTFTLIFDQFVASIGPGVGVAETRKNCQINLNMQYPSGFQYSIFSTQYRGYVELDSGVNALQSSTFYFSGETGQSTTSTSFKGPINGNYEAEDDVALTSTVWSPCGAPAALNINSQVRLTTSSTTASGQITDDSIDGKITFVVGVQWQKC